MFASAASQFFAVAGSVQRLASNFRIYKTAPHVRVMVSGGLHDRCVRQFARDSIRIGSEPDFDLVLLDPMIAVDHAQVSFDHSLMGVLVTVRAIAPGVLVNRGALAPGRRSSPQRLPLDLQLADGIRLKISKDDRSSLDDTQSTRPTGSLRYAVAVLALAVAGLYALENWGARTYALHLSSSPELVGIASESGVVGFADLQTKLTQVGLDRLVRVTENGDGLLVVEGSLTPAQRVVWQQVASWYDATTFGRPLVTRLTSGAGFTDIPPITIVRLSEPRAIILATGETLSVNDRFSDDWVISAINDTGIVIQLGEETKVLDFSGSGS